MRLFALLMAFAVGFLNHASAQVAPDPVLEAKHQPHPAPDQAVVLDWKTGAGGSYLIPAVEVPGFLSALSIVDRITIPHDVYNSTLNSTWEHVHEQHWVFDTDPFNINQFAHPYQGSMMFGFARSTGVGFWQSLIYSNVGSFIWKMAGETDLPSINDQITTGTAGAILGETLFRMASLLLERGGEHPGFWRELGAAALSPPTGFNRLVFGKRFRAVFPSYDPATFSRLRIGATFDANYTSSAPPNSGGATPPPPSLKQEAVVDYTFIYGLPGKAGYGYDRPFDYFSLEAAGETSAHTHNFVEDIMIRGMLYGTDFAWNANHRAIAGVYASYDYISPQAFRISSTAVGPGTTHQWWLSKSIAMQATAMAAVGFGGAGKTPGTDGLRDYHYGATPQGLIAWRTIFGHRAMLDVTARDYYVSGTGSDDRRGSEQVFRGDAGVTVRLFGHQALGLEFLLFDRKAHYVAVPNEHQTEGKFSVVYTLLGGSRFGAVDWRPNGKRLVE
jgi:hypothetical protein